MREADFLCWFECFAKCNPGLIDKNLACVEHACEGGKAMNHPWPASVPQRHLRPLILKFTQMLIRTNAEMIAEVERAGIKPNWEDPSSLFSDRPWITQCPREFDFESSHWPEQFHYAGPFHDGEGRPELSFPWNRLTGEPIVYASMGTVQNGNADVFRMIAAAVAKHKGAQLVLSIGNILGPEQIGPVPKNAIVVNHAPQLELLKKASICITHAGFNTVLEALTQGVPQVAIPITKKGIRPNSLRVYDARLITFDENVLL
jgi:MGT family glycosyltransferase